MLATVLAIVLLLVACSGPNFSIGVRDIIIPASSSGGTICYVKGSESSPRRFSSATYRAEATYHSHSSLLPSEQVGVRVYGRSQAPTRPCVSDSGPQVDLPLSEEITLRREEAKTVEVGGNEYGSRLAELISREDYWIGAQISAGYTLGAKEEIHLEQGRISVSLW